MLLGVGLAVRIALAFVVYPHAGYTGDLGQFWQWAQGLAANGPGAFYTTIPSANYPPLYLYVLWVLGSIGNPDLLKLPPILLGFTILAAAFFVLPTRVHERYLFPFFATGALLAAPGALRIAVLAAAAVLNTLNLHAVLAGNLFLSAGGGGGARGGGFSGGFGNRGFGRGGGFGGGGFSSINLPWGDLARSELVVVASAVGLVLALAVLLAAWAVVVLRPQWVAVRPPRTAPSVP